jgi:hypothetical protein
VGRAVSLRTGHAPLGSMLWARHRCHPAAGRDYCPKIQVKKGMCRASPISGLIIEDQCHFPTCGVAYDRIPVPTLPVEDECR